MNEKILYWASVGFSALALILLSGNVAMINANRAQQNEFTSRQSTINGGTTLSQINQSLVQALAQASVDNDDKDIRQLLTAQGITVTKNAAAAPAEAAKK